MCYWPCGEAHPNKEKIKCYIISIGHYVAGDRIPDYSRSCVVYGDIRLVIINAIVVDGYQDQTEVGSRERLKS